VPTARIQTTAEVTDYLNTLGYRLVAASADSRQEFTFS
jgi:predicted Zn-dependent protease